MSSFRDKVDKAWDTTAERETVRGVEVEIRSMSVLDKARLLKNASTNGLIDTDKWYQWVVISCCYDPETGEKAFTEEDLEWLSSKSSDTIVELAGKCLGISAMGSNKAVDEAGKDS